jgi:ferrochelatase
MEFIPKNHPEIKYGKIGVLIINLGTPDATDYWSIRKYLKEFLSDRRVIDINKYLWWIILNVIILTFRPSKTAKAYKAIWNLDKDESPLKTYTRSQAEALEEDFKEVEIFWSMRYGNPSISSVLKAMRNKGIDRILIFPLYPQYAAATTATVNDKVFEELSKMRWQPSIRTMPPFFDNPLYIDALNSSVQKHIESLEWKPEILLTSYHGLPKRYLDLGDPYHCHCHKTTRLLKEKLNYFSGETILAFQSRFGPEEWLKPYTEETVINLAKNGCESLAILSPAFISDCVETL